MSVSWRYLLCRALLTRSINRNSIRSQSMCSFRGTAVKFRIMECASRPLLQRPMKLHRNSNIRVDGRTKNGRKERAGAAGLGTATAYREIGVLRPDGVVSVVALVGVPVHRGLFGGGVGEEEARVAVVVGRGSGRVGRARVRGKRRRRDCVSDRPPLLTRRPLTASQLRRRIN